VAAGPDPDRRDPVPGGPDDPQSGRMRPISRRLLVGLAVLGGAIGWTVVATIEHGGGVAPTVSWLTPVAWAFLAALLFPKASAFVGALCVGVYAGFALRFVDAFDSDGPRNRIITAGLSAVFAVLVVLAGLLLERACRVPGKPDETP
jgi:hypothetical protein